MHYPWLCQNNMTHVALRGRRTTSAYNCFPATDMFFNLKFFANVKKARPRPHVCSTGALCLATLTPTGGSSDKHGYMAFLILAKWEWQVKDLFVVGTTLLAKSHRCWVVGTCEPTRGLKAPLWRREREQDELMIKRDLRKERRGPSFARFKLKIPDQTQAGLTRLDYISFLFFSFWLDG